MKFNTTLEQNGKTATGITVPESIVEALGGGKRAPVRVSIGSYTYRSTIAVMGGAYKIPVSAEHRDGAGINAGDAIEVDLELDTSPRDIGMPADFAAALEAVPEAKHFFEGLSNSLQRYWTGQIEGAKTPETRRRRIDGAIAKLREGKSR